jgi:hypothetical protein
MPLNTTRQTSSLVQTLPNRKNFNIFRPALTIQATQSLKTGVGRDEDFLQQSNIIIHI